MYLEYIIKRCNIRRHGNIKKAICWINVIGSLRRLWDLLLILLPGADAQSLGSFFVLVNLKNVTFINGDQ